MCHLFPWRIFSLGHYFIIFIIEILISIYIYIYLKYERIFLWGTLVFFFWVLASACYLLICRYLAGQLCLNLASHNLAKFSYYCKVCPKHVMVVSTWTVGSPAHTGILTSFFSAYPSFSCIISLPRISNINWREQSNACLTHTPEVKEAFSFFIK